jgi:hypothetical protein
MLLLKNNEPKFAFTEFPILSRNSLFSAIFYFIFFSILYLLLRFQNIIDNQSEFYHDLSAINQESTKYIFLMLLSKFPLPLNALKILLKKRYAFHHLL